MCFFEKYETFDEVLLSYNLKHVVHVEDCTCVLRGHSRDVHVDLGVTVNTNVPF